MAHKLTIFNAQCNYQWQQQMTAMAVWPIETCFLCICLLVKTAIAFQSRRVSHSLCVDLFFLRAEKCAFSQFSIRRFQSPVSCNESVITLLILLSTLFLSIIFRFLDGIRLCRLFLLHREQRKCDSFIAVTMTTATTTLREISIANRFIEIAEHYETRCTSPTDKLLYSLLS